MTSQGNSARIRTVALFETPIILARLLWSECRYVPGVYEKSASLLLTVWRGNFRKQFLRDVCVFVVTGKEVNW